MESSTESHWERSLEQLAARFEYPPTPPLTGGRTGALPAAGGRRRPAAGRRSGRGSWSAVIRPAFIALLLLVAALLAVPATRAALVSFLARVGAIEIFSDETAPTPAPPPATPTPLPRPTTAPAGAAAARATARPSATAQPTATPEGMVAHSLALIALGQPTTLAEAERLVGFTPGLPAALGAPDEVYHHRGVDLPALTLVWRPSDGPPLSLTAIGVAEFGRKFVAGAAVTEVAVGETTGYWLEGPHHLQLLGFGQDTQPILIASNVLIWVQDGITYRLEGDLTRDEALAIAASLAP